MQARFFRLPGQMVERMPLCHLHITKTQDPGRDESLSYRWRSAAVQENNRFLLFSLVPPRPAFVHS